MKNLVQFLLLVSLVAATDGPNETNTELRVKELNDFVAVDVQLPAFEKNEWKLKDAQSLVADNDDNMNKAKGPENPDVLLLPELIFDIQELVEKQNEFQNNLKTTDETRNRPESKLDANREYKKLPQLKKSPMDWKKNLDLKIRELRNEVPLPEAKGFKEEKAEKEEKERFLEEERTVEFAELKITQQLRKKPLKAISDHVKGLQHENQKKVKTTTSSEKEMSIISENATKFKQQISEKNEKIRTLTTEHIKLVKKQIFLQNVLDGAVAEGDIRKQLEDEKAAINQNILKAQIKYEACQNQLSKFSVDSKMVELTGEFKLAEVLFYRAAKEQEILAKKLETEQHRRDEMKRRLEETYTKRNTLLENLKSLKAHNENVKKNLATAMFLEVKKESIILDAEEETKEALSMKNSCALELDELKTEKTVIDSEIVKCKDAISTFLFPEWLENESERLRIEAVFIEAVSKLSADKTPIPDNIQKDYNYFITFAKKNTKLKELVVLEAKKKELMSSIEVKTVEISELLKKLLLMVQSVQNH